MKSATVVYGT